MSVVLEVPITQAKIARADLDDAAALNQLVAGRVYYLTDEKIYVGGVSSSEAVFLGAAPESINYAVPGTGNVWDDINTHTFTGPDSDGAGRLPINESASVLLTHNGSTYFWGGPRPVCIGAGGAGGVYPHHLVVEADLLPSGLTSHALLTGRDQVDAHPQAAITNLTTDQATQNGRLSILETDQITQNSRLDTVEAGQATQDGRLDGLDAGQTTQDGRLTALESGQATQDGRLDGLDAGQVVQNGRLDGLDAGQAVQDGRLTANEGRLDGLDTGQTTQDGRLTALETEQGAQSGRLDGLDTGQAAQDGRLGALELEQGSQGTRLDGLDAGQAVQDGRLGALELEQGSQGTRLDTIETGQTVQDGRLDGLDTGQATQNGRLDTIETGQTVQDGRLDGLDTGQATQNGRLDTLEASQLAQDVEIATKIGAVVEDDDPNLGGELNSAGYDILLQDVGGVQRGVIGAVDPGSPYGAGAYIAHSPDEDYDVDDGGLLLQAGSFGIFGAAVEVQALKVANETEQQLVLANPVTGQLSTMPLPEPGWEVSAVDATDTDLGSGVAEGPWTELTNLTVQNPEDTVVGQRLTAHVNLDVLVTAGTGELHVGIGVGGAQPTSHEKFILTNGFDGFKSLTIITTAAAAHPANTTFSVWVRRGAALEAGFSGQWDVKHQTGNPNSKECNAYTSGEHRIHHRDDPNENDRGSELNQIEPGWDFSYAGYSGVVTGTTKRNNDIRLQCTPSGRGSTGQQTLNFGPKFALTLTGSVSQHELFLSTPTGGVSQTQRKAAPPVTTGGNITLDLTDGVVHTVTLNANSDFIAIDSATNGSHLTLYLDNSGGHTVAWTFLDFWAGGAPTIGTGVYLLDFIRVNDQWIGFSYGILTAA